MKLDLFLFLFAVSLAFLSGNITYFIKSEGNADLKDLDEIRKLHVELQEEISPSKRLDLNIDYPTPERLKLLLESPSISSNKRKIILNSSECLKSKISQLSSSFINKETLWLGFLCNQIDHLPLTFFTSPPFIHSNGVSYSYMKFKMIHSHIDRINWLEDHAKYMHISEIKDLHWPTSTNQRFLIKQSQEVLKRIISGENTFLTDTHYYIKSGNLKYYIIDINIAKRFFKRARYTFSDGNIECIFKVGNVCWKKKPHNLQSLMSQSTIVLFFGTIIILLLTARSLFTRLKRKKLEEDRKKHALRILTHELRTPIASLLLQINQLNKNIEDIPLEVQDPFMKIESQVYRLKHLAEKSQSYLQTDTTELINMNRAEIPSLKDFLEGLLFEYDNQDIKIISKNDSAIYQDPYWLKMCVMNLIDNGIRYGESPIELEIDSSEKNIILKVRDQGSIPYNNLKELLKGKHENSKGLGLGLIIVNKTLKEMGAKLSLSSTPTEFTITFNKRKSENKNE
ncbi:MAG: anti-sigma regulatory factor (Ser/Thr protein kinase) [Bacteriovoracaceae bacterium]|jgi:anti-sigma regulatory factor (Ser/Thr protein kinase)